MICLLKKVSTPEFGSFELGTQEAVNVPIWVIVGFQRRDGLGLQKLNNDSVYWNNKIQGSWHNIKL